MQNSTVDVQPLGSTTGAEIFGVDLGDDLTDITIADIRNALNTHGVIFFRDQQINEAQHVALARRFGPIHVLHFSTCLPGYPEIGTVTKAADATRNVGGRWHSDQAFDADPPLGTILVARKLPEFGGDTLFASTGAAYDSLSDGLKKTLAGLKVVQSKRYAYEEATGEHKPSAEKLAKYAKKLETHAHGGVAIHPVVCRHPESGRKVLFVNPTHSERFEGWTVEESRPLLQYLYDHITRPENTCRFRWRNGSVAFWDNRATIHLALNDYHGSYRLMHRITIKGRGMEAAA
jgi:taurine dioxygenase